jgi:hypothetical protein
MIVPARRAPILVGMSFFVAMVATACSGTSTIPNAPPASGGSPAGTSGNLILNGDAELGDATLTGYDSVTIPGWKEDGLPTVVAYGIGGFPKKTSPGAGGGRNFFTGGPFSSSTLRQTIAVSSASSAIDAGGVKFALSGRLGGNGKSRDSAQLIASFRNGSGVRIGRVAIGPVTPADRKHVTGFVARSARGAIPRGTRSIEVVLQFVMYETFVESVSLDNGYADDLSLALSTPATPPTLPPSPTPAVPKFDHIFFVYFENSAYDQIIGNTSSAPFINRMAKQYSVLGNYYALHHPSDANYVLQAAGGTYGLHQNDFAGFPIAANHLADTIEKAGGTWKQYMESAHGNCDQTPHDYYYPDDGPYMYFDDVRNDKARCDAHIVPFTHFSKDLASDATTPQYAWLSPDDCDDMEACGIAAGDDFLKKAIVAPLLKSPAWTQHNTLLIISWDEDDFSPINHIPGIFMSRTHVKNGFISPVRYTHYSVLKTIETSLGLPNLTNNDRYAALINDIWQ